MNRRINSILTSYQMSQTNPDGVPCGGTAVFIVHRQRSFLCTVRHAIDRNYSKPGHNYPLATALTLTGMFKTDHTKVDRQSVNLQDLNWVADQDDHDLATCENFDQSVFHNKIPLMFSSSEFAVFQGNWSEPRADIGCDIFYSGYPDAIKQHGEDRQPLVTRQGILACDLRTQIDVPKVTGKNYGLVDSYAQRGFSGAPLWSSVSFEGPTVEIAGNQFGLQKSVVLQAQPSHKLLGLICGHYRTVDDGANGAHSGLSYFVKCDQIERHLDSVTQ